MSENDQSTAAAETVEASEPADVTEQDTGKSDEGKTFTQAELDKILEQRLSRERAKFSDYEKIKADAAELARIRDAEKSELQKAIERAEEAEIRASKAEFTAMRNKVAAAKGVPASSLTGKTEDELMASADELIAWRDQQKQPAPKRTPASGGGLKSGASGAENTNHDPKAAAAEALRRLRSAG